MQMSDEDDDEDDYNDDNDRRLCTGLEIQQRVWMYITTKT